MTGTQRTGIWPRLAAIAGVVLAIVLTAAIWFQVIDRQATATLGGADSVSGTPATNATPAPYVTGTPSPIP